MLAERTQQEIINGSRKKSTQFLIKGQHTFQTLLNEIKKTQCKKIFT